MYEQSSGDTVNQFPPDIYSEYESLKEVFNPLEEDSIEDVRRCFEEHKKFAKEAKKVIKEKIDEIDQLKEKMERVEYMREADDNFEHDGFEQPTISEDLSSFVNERIENRKRENEDDSSSSEDSMEKMNINQIAYFIAEDIRKKRDDEYDMDLYHSLENAYPEQVMLIRETVAFKHRAVVKNRLSDLGQYENLPPLKDAHIEFYIIPRVFEEIPAKTPEEIGMI